MQAIKWVLFALLFLGFNHQAHATETVITSIPSSGLTISAPGTYVFGNDISWTPTANGQAILITTSDVTLDLKNHKLKCTDPTYSTTGIVALLSENLIIKNGTVSNFSYRGVDCAACAKVKIKHITVKGLSLENTIVYTVPVGIIVTASDEVLVKKCKVKNVDVRTGSCAAIQMTATTHSKIHHCDVSNMLNRDGACTGIGHFLCDDAEVKSCKLDGIKTEFINNLNTEGHTAIGLIPFISTNLLLSDCKISNITGCCDDAHGISVFECTNAKVENCKVFNVLDGAGPAQTGAKATGIEVYGSDVKVIKCHVNYIAAINPQDKQATGFSCAQGSRIKFIKCKAENVKVYNEIGFEDTSKGYGTGFGWAPDPRIIEPAVDVLYKKCTAKYCQVGFDSWFHINSVWKHIYSKCNGIDILNLDDTAQRTLSCDPCSECGCTFPGCYPNPLVVTITNVASNNVFVDVKKVRCN
jgi:hypothetical protein